MSTGTSIPELSLVVATFNRGDSLRRLLDDLSRQSLAPDRFEAVIVDDGSQVPAEKLLEGQRWPFAVRILRQENRGAACARHAGALAARGELLVFTDDDMELPPGFLAEHLAHHRETPRAVVLGRMQAPPDAGAMPLFERWHQAMLDGMAAQLRQPGATPRGNQLYTGNVSMPRAEYLQSGGFDPQLGHSEDAELGLRLEARGCRFLFSNGAYSVHRSDHSSLEKWLARSFKYGRFDAKIGQKHAGVAHADPWRFFFELSPLTRPLLVGALAAPKATEAFGRKVMALADAVDRAGIERAALTATTVVFGLQYFRGLREDAGSFAGAVAQLARHVGEHRVGASRSALRIAREVAANVTADQATVRRYESKYGHRSPSQGSLASDVTQKIGLQILAAYRLMRALHAARATTAAKAVSRMIRHLYGSDLHWEAQLAPGVMIVHGMGLAISHSARVAEGCILFQNVTLGMGTDPLTGAIGAPTLERNVHVGPGATLLGPIRIGEGSKIMAGAVVTESVPPHSVVRAPSPTIVARSARPTTGVAVNEAAASVAEHGATGI